MKGHITNLLRVFCLSIVTIYSIQVSAQATIGNCVSNSIPVFSECTFTAIDYDQCFMNSIIVEYLEIVDFGNKMQYMTITYENHDGTITDTLLTMTRTANPFVQAPIYSYGPSVIDASLGNGWKRIEFTNIPSSVLSGETFYIKFDGRWIAGGGSSAEFVDLSRSVTLSKPGTPSGGLVTTDRCGEIEVNWTDGALLACLSNQSYSLIYRNGSFVGSVPYGTTSWTDYGPFSMGTDYDYTVRHTYPNSVLSNSASSNNTGRIKSTPEFPSGIEVSTDRCDGVVSLNWGYVSDATQYRVFRDNVLIHTTATANNTSFDDENVVRGVYYNYQVQSANECGAGAASNYILGASPLEPSGPGNVWVEEEIGVGARISWQADSLITGYKIERNLLGGGGATYFNLPPSDTFYIDNSIALCQQYQYRVYSVNDCAPNGVVSDSARTIIRNPDLSTMFDADALQGSKGYFSNRVQLNWTLANNANNVNAFKIYRKQLGSSEDSVLITSQNSGSNLFQDYLTDAGVLYEYFIIAELQCDQQTVYSNMVSTIGFRSATGTLTGQVSYTGGIAVEDVKIAAENASGSSGASLQFFGTDSLMVPNNNNFDITNEFTAEMWFQPSGSGDYSLIEKEGVFKLAHMANDMVFTVWDTNAIATSINIPNSTFLLDEYHQLTVTLSNDSLILFLNGEREATSYFGSSLANSSAPLVVGNGFIGYLDEFRLWSVGSDNTRVNRDFSRQLNGVNSQLEIYLRFDEAFGSNAYDFSRTSNSLFHKNHAQIFGNASWSYTIPTASQLSNATYTDSLGNYLLVVPYAGNGETFVITPSFLDHNFSPATRALFLGDGSTIHNNVDFEDISSFTVEGSLFFANTSCPVEGATLLIDGEVVIENGLPVTTDSVGAYNIQVPIGNHFVSVEMNQHVMSVGRFPASGTHDFQQDLANVNFVDTTLVKVVGRVVGGLKQASYAPGMDLSTNNIGQANITFTSQLANGCATQTVVTDYNSGEYELFLPPLRYIPSVNIPTQPTINFGVLNMQDLTNELDVFMAYDTIGYDSTLQIYYIDSIQYNKQIDYIHRNNPAIVVKDKNLVDDFIGDTLYTFVHTNGDTIQVNLKTNPFPWPIFNGIGNDERYTCLITAFESYTNFQTNQLDTVPTTDGEVIFNNQLSKNPSATIQLSDVNTLDSLKYIKYSFDLSNPNFNQNINIPEYSFVRTFELNLALPNGTTIPWKPDVFNGNGSAAFNTVYDQIFRGYILGTKSDGQQFITAGPQVPEYVLRDPPGSSSYAERAVGTTKTTENNWSWTLGGNLSAESSVFVGQKFNSGLGVAIETDVLQDITYGSETIVQGGRSGSESVSVTNTQSWQTDASSNKPGKDSDLYIGKSKNVTFGISETLKLVPDSIAGQVDSLAAAGNNFIFAQTYGVSIIPEGYATQFIYTEDHIKNQLIPDLVELRNALLSDPSRYTSYLPTTDPNYGLSNDDPRITNDSSVVTAQDRVNYLLRLGDESYTQPVVVGGLLQVGETHYRPSAERQAKWDLFNAYENADTLSIEGASYTFHAQNLQDSLTGDSVRWINNQIKHWEESIMLNEWEKVHVNNAGIRDALKGMALRSLYKEYEDYIIAYNTFVAASGVAAIGTIVADQVIPGAPTTFVSFAVSSGIGIAESELYDKMIEYIAKRDNIYSKFAQTPANYSISSGGTFSNSISHETVSTVNRTLHMGMTASMSLDLTFKVNNTGVGLNKGLKLNHATEKGGSNSNSNTETVNFTLSDQDPGDFYSVDVYGSLLGWGPVFKLQPGGQTSCPHEDELLSEFYIEDVPNANNPNSPFYLLSEGTQQRDKPTIDVAPSILTNIPITDPAVFNLTINNESESNDTRTYKIALLTTSNPFGAIVTVDGATTFADVTVPAGSSVNKVLAIEKGPGPTYNYDSLIIITYSECDPAQKDSVYVSAHFLPTCTEVSFATPDNQWVLNNSFNDTLPIAVIDYNINFFDFNSIRLDYKPSAQSQWVGLQTFHKDTSGLNDPTALEIPTNTPFTLWNWMTDQVVDGDYDLRLVSQCTLADKISLTHSGLMDRINPHPFGTPSPADGILDPSEDISIRFNEPIDLGSLTQLNFDVRGVLNGTETTHATSLYFDGVDDEVVVSAGAPLQNRDFTLEFSVKRNSLGAATILSQGADEQEQIFVGFDDTDHLMFKINGFTLTSNTTYTDNNWHYFAVAYNFENETAEMYEASGASTASIINSGNVAIYPDYSGAGPMLIGADAAQAVANFEGQIDDVRIWNETRTLNEFSLTKSVILSSNEAGLLYNYRLDEATGTIAYDHVRARNGIINGASWVVQPNGNSAEFDGVDDYLRVAKGDVNITEAMDFTMEFWFQSTQSGAATLFSNGTGEATAADSLYSWNIAKDAAGNIHVQHNGIDFTATNANYFDGNWHHFALVLNRQANLTAYIDGNLEQSMPATEFGGLGAPALYIGARGFYNMNTEQFDSYFEGRIDEFRLWNTSRTYEQVSRDKQNRMQADELGLKLYLPFENYELDPTGVPLLTPTFEEQIDAALHPTDNPNGVNLSAITPTIKLPRPIQSIAFNYSVNNDEIIIIPTTDPALIENVTLDVTVENVLDLHGNQMESPKTWVAYVDKNQVVWQDDLLSFDLDYGAGAQFTANVVNLGGVTKDFTIEQIPNWLTVTPTSGTLAPNSVQAISFEIDPYTNIGSYLQDIQLLTDFGYAEHLSIDLKVSEQAPNWSVNPVDFQYSMNIIGYLSIEGVIATDEEDLLGVFVNDEPRGVASLSYVASIDRYIAFLDVYSNAPSNETLKFKIWDASTGSEYVDVIPQLTFAANNTIGTLLAPQLFEAGNAITQNIPIYQGWNWIAFNLLSEDSTNLDSLMVSYQPSYQDYLKSQLIYANYAASSTWVGTLSNPNNGGVKMEEGYRLKAQEGSELILEGQVIDPTTRTVSLQTGWNWIGFISIRNQSVTEAFGNLTPMDGDLIKGQAQFAVYDNNLGWLGSLTTMVPGKSYMYYSGGNNSFTFPYAGAFKSLNSEIQAYSDPRWPVNEFAHAGNMTQILQLDLCENVGSAILSAQYLIGAFDAAGVCRGLSTLDEVNNQVLSFLTISGESSEILHYRLLHKESGTSILLENELSFVTNKMDGSVQMPATVLLNDETCKALEQQQLTYTAANISVYPTIFDNEIKVNYLSESETSLKITLTNSMGQVVLSKKYTTTLGAQEITMDVSKLNVAKGAYYLEIEEAGIAIKHAKLLHF